MPNTPQRKKPLLEVKLGYNASTAKPSTYGSSREEPAIASATVSLKGDPDTVSELYHAFSKLVEAKIK